MMLEYEGLLECGTDRCSCEVVVKLQLDDALPHVIPCAREAASDEWSNGAR